MSDVFIGILIATFVIGFVLSFSMGANDVANAYGTSYGSKVLTFKQVCILATFFEVAGSVLLGGAVSDTISKGIVDIDLYADDVPKLFYGYLSALFGASGWLMIATVFKLPVSGTHSIVGAVLGFTLVANGTNGVHWMTIVKVISSWFTSPILSGLISTALYLLVKYLVLKRTDPLAAGCCLLPVLYACILAINVYMALNEALKTFDLTKVLPIWGVILVAIGAGIFCGILILFFLMPWIRRKVEERMKSSLEPQSAIAKVIVNSGTQPAVAPVLGPNYAKEPQHRPSRFGRFLMGSSAIEMSDFGTPVNRTTILATHKSKLDLANYRAESDKEEQHSELPEICHLFSFVQVVTACFASFSHGGNDVSNAIGPIIGAWRIYETGEAATEGRPTWWILVYGGAGMSVGLCALGRRVLETIGTDLASISPISGFSMDLGSALTVLIASHLGIPISTTHCLVGSVVAVSFFRSRKGVDWRIARNILFSWGVTVPVSCGLSAACMITLKSIFDATNAFEDWYG